MKNVPLVSVLAAGLALFAVGGAFPSATPTALNPTPNRDNKLLADFETATTVTSDPNAAGANLASINTDPQFVANGSQSLKLDFTGMASGWHDHEFTINLAQPVDIKGYQVLAMDVFVPMDSLADPTSYYQFDPRTTTTDPNDATKTVTSYYGPRNLAPGWNHLIWNLQSGTDTQISQIDSSGNSGADYAGPFYIDNIRVYKGNFAGLQPDEQLIFGFDNSSDPGLFTSGDSAPIKLNTDKQFISQGAGSLMIDMTGISSGWSQGLASAAMLGSTLDVSKATAIHLDIFGPAASAPTGTSGWHELGFAVIGDNGQFNGQTAGPSSGGYVDGQWNTLELPMTPDQAKMVGHVQGIVLIRNSGDTWNGPVYIDNLRAVIPTQ